MEPDKIEVLCRPLKERFKELEKLMSEPRFHESPSFAAVAREHSAIAQKLGRVSDHEKLLQELVHLSEILQHNDPELSELAQQEKEIVQQKLAASEKELARIFFPRDPNDDKNIIIEIRAGTGGEEAALFAQELARLYMKYAENRGFRNEIVSSSLADRGGFKEVIFSIEKKEGDARDFGAFSIFKFESGVHRVQRVPVTEASGRIHTSTVTVAVLPEADEVDVSLRIEDLRIDTYRASGHGGQHLQKTDSAVRITHLPTNIVVQCQDERSQQKNKEKALKFLRAKLFQMAREDQEKRTASDRKKQIGTGERSEKIRTYNFPQDRVTDHRIGLSLHHIEEVMEGALDPMTEALQMAERQEIETQSRT